MVEARSGSVTAIQRCGGALNANVQFHALIFDGVYTRPTPTTRPVFHRLPPPSDADIAALLTRRHRRVRRLLVRRGRLAEEAQGSDPFVAQEPLFAQTVAAALQGRGASGARRRMREVEGWGRHLRNGPAAAAKPTLALTHPSNLRERYRSSSHRGLCLTSQGWEPDSGAPRSPRGPRIASVDPGRSLGIPEIGHFPVLRAPPPQTGTAASVARRDTTRGAYVVPSRSIA
ncbi:MAG: transposase [Candidatus Rokubacteria bacterium]|nr:transposase [Candidatus Rokubacteria bacterium]